ncbi:signal peptidase II [Candidatus Soleaferrea massiliensis]|uniref:signal peptidase II n=1 Tax=Candidatus Soleaferrea massiliensis TaxID=1470354 RepID=UPI000590D8E6|nr:signal peptidase II [Candidatus Soleaferrea massiliensis]
MGIYIALVSIVVLIGVDQLIKFLVDANMVVGQSIPVIQNIFHLTYVENKGSAFGLFSGHREFLIIIAVVLLAAGVWLMLSRKIKGNFVLTCAAMIIAGGLGNLIDRIFRGAIIDYLDFPFLNFYIFNFADCLVVVGVICFIVYLLFGDYFKRKKHVKLERESV